MATEHGSRSERRSVPDLLTWVLLGTVVVALVVVPAAVLALGSQYASVGLSLRAFGFLAMAPGVLLGAASLLVMLGSR